MEYKTETTLIPSNKFDELFACQGNSLQTVEPPTCRLKTPENQGKKSDNNDNRVVKQEQKKINTFPL